MTDQVDLSAHLALIECIDEREEDITDIPDLDHIGALVAFVLHQEQVVPMGVTVTLVDEPVMHQLNREHMETDRPTDVLAFPLDEPEEAAGDDEHPHLLGDVVLAPQYIANQASQHNQSTEEELKMLVVHGTLHLLGYDHAHEEERKVMFGLTDELLLAWEAAAWTQ